MTFRLRDNLHWCACGGRVIFLDLEADRYICLPFAAEAAFLRVAHGEMRQGDADRLRPLLARRMLIEDDRSAGPGPPPEFRAATRDLLEEPFPPARFADMLAALASQARSAWLLRASPLLDVLRSVQSRASPQGPGPADVEARLCRIVSAFAATSILAGVAERCLVRALALHSTCRRHGIRPQLLFGVRVNPFRAHCWIQLDEAVLIGDLEQVRLFTPILMLG